MELLKCLALFVSLAGVITNGESALTSIIQTHRGPVRGEISTTVENELKYAAFKGIPYAQAPLGLLRFKPPKEREAWTEVLDATSEGSMCTQFNETSSTVVGSEDCLYINVFTPHTEFNSSISKPVLVWIHGGAFRTGNSNASYYGPDFLLEEDVIVVSFNYRLGPLGFLNINHENATGNYGLKDQNLALKWVQKNIANFGGNPKKVTIVGQSAGSVAVDLHVLSDMSHGLFSQSIAMSGAPLCLYWGFQSSLEAEKQAFILGSKLGTNTLSKDKLLETLYKASAVDIINKTHDIPLIPFRPTIESTSVAKNEDKFLTECTLKKYTLGNYNKGPQIMGFTSSETVAFAGSASNLLDMANTALSSIKTATLSIELPFLSEIAALTTDSIYNLTESSINKIVKETSDLFFVTGIDSKQKMLNIHNGYPIYYYRFSFNSPYSAHKTDGNDLDGVGHEDDLPYVFYRPHVELPLDQPDIEITRRRFVRMWTNFVKYGNPTPDGTNDSILGITWPNSGLLGRHLEFNRNLSIGLRPTDTTVKTFETAGLGTSPILNECSKNLISNAINGIGGGISNGISNLFEG